MLLERHLAATSELQSRQALNRLPHLSLNVETIAPSQEWLADYPGWTFVKVASGFGYVLAKSIAHELSPGQIVVGSGVPITYRASELGLMELHWFWLCPELLTGFFTLSEEHYLQTVAPQVLPRVQILPATHKIAQQFPQISSPGANSLETRHRLLGLVATLLAENVKKRRSRRYRPITAGARFEQLVASRPAAEIQAMPLSELARECGCSERHFQRLFRAHLGCSVRAQQLEVRLQAATKLLRDSKESMQRIAMESGFANLGLFRAAFKKRFGTSPAQWREDSRPKPFKARAVRNPPPPLGPPPAVSGIVAKL